MKTFLKNLGPGILLAGAAIGGSHLVASTQAGANYGWSLLGILLMINLFKYPFLPLFAAIHRGHRRKHPSGIPQAWQELSYIILHHSTSLPG
jgi:Mn2+/Fe2+ NRAMP family transporter